MRFLIHREPHGKVKVRSRHRIVGATVVPLICSESAVLVLIRGAIKVMPISGARDLQATDDPSGSITRPSAGGQGQGEVASTRTMSHPGQVKPDGASSRTVDSGWMCGSFLGLAIVLVLPVVLVLGIMSAAGDFPVIVPICGGLGMLIAAAGFRSGFILTIEDDRLQMRMVLQKYV